MRYSGTYLLGYTQDWFDLGMLTVSTYQAQIKAYNLGKDGNEEHYRYHTFTAFLKDIQTVNEQQLAQIIKLSFNDKDVSLRSAFLLKLLEEVYLNGSQLEILYEVLLGFGVLGQKRVRRHQIINQLQKEPLSEALFEEALLEKDIFIHNVLLTLDLQKHHLVALSEKGHNKRIKNICLNRLGKK